MAKGQKEQKGNGKFKILLLLKLLKFPKLSGNKKDTREEKQRKVENRANGAP